MLGRRRQATGRVWWHRCSEWCWQLGFVTVMTPHHMQLLGGRLSRQRSRRPWCAACGARWRLTVAAAAAPPPHPPAPLAAPLCRDISRQEYLKKREEAKLEELKEALEDEKYLFQASRQNKFNRAVKEHCLLGSAQQLVRQSGMTVCLVWQRSLFGRAARPSACSAHSRGLAAGGGLRRAPQGRNLLVPAQLPPSLSVARSTPLRQCGRGSG